MNITSYGEAGIYRQMGAIAQAMEDCAKTGKPWATTGPWTNFWNPDTAPHQPWMDRMENVTRIGRHMFGEER